MQQRTVVWESLDGAGLEYLSLEATAEAVQVESVVIHLQDEGAFRLHYRVACDADYRVRTVDLLVANRGELHLTTDGAGKWYDGAGQPLPALATCLDIDITATPFTNTLPIRRLRWQPAHSEVINVVYISVPELTVQVEEQRYTCLEQNEQGSVYRFEHLSSGFTALLPIDKEGLVTDYPELFNRLYAKES